MGPATSPSAPRQPFPFVLVSELVFGVHRDRVPPGNMLVTHLSCFYLPPPSPLLPPFLGLLPHFCLFIVWVFHRRERMRGLGWCVWFIFLQMAADHPSLWHSNTPRCVNMTFLHPSLCCWTCRRRLLKTLTTS